MQRLITRKDLYARLGELSKEFELIGPKEVQGKGVFYENINDIKELCLGKAFSVWPVKRFFFSPSECLAKETLQSNSVILEEMLPEDKKRIAIGVTPCEARGLTLLDKVFDADYKDNFYVNNRERTAIIGLACLQPDKSCFCTSMSGSPVESRGMDAMLFETGDSFVADIITEKGKEIFSPTGKELSEDKIKEFLSEKEKMIDLVKTRIKVPEPKDLDAVFASDYWFKASHACLGCGICTYLCPSCHCFDLVDEERRKMKCYDACSFRDFTLQASGENPRPAKKDRYRQRVFHKFNYFKNNFGENLCVGCGRCIRNCPVKINIAGIIDNAPVS